MKIKRYKRVRRYLNFYKNHFSIDKPYKIIADGTFCKAALDNKINLLEQMTIYFGGEIQLYTTSCVVKELELLGPSVYGALLIAKGYKKVFCKHKKSTTTAADCLSKIAGKTNDKKFFFATQDRSLTENLREKVVGCPILFINYNTVLLDNPSQLSVDTVAGVNEEKINFEGVQKENLLSLKKSNLLPSSEEELKKKKRRKIKGPNPLSVKKKKRPTVVVGQKSTKEGDERSRKRKSRHRRGNNAKKAKLIVTT